MCVRVVGVCVRGCECMRVYVCVCLFVCVSVCLRFGVLVSMRVLCLDHTRTNIVQLSIHITSTSSDIQ